MHTTCSSSSLNATRFTAVGNSHVCKHLPVETDHSFNVLSADPETMNFDCASKRFLRNVERRQSYGKGLTVHINCQDCTIVTIIRTQTFAIVGKPNIDDMILRAGEQKIAFSIELDLCQ